jgi:hypothetical protein
MGGRSLPIYASQLVVVLLVIHIGFIALAQRSFGAVPSTMRWLLAATALLAVPLVWSSDRAAGILAYFNFASGIVGGVAIALVWRSMSRDYSWIDIGYVVFLLVGVAQLLTRYSTASGLNSLHQSSPMPWGVPSIVAGSLVVAALIVMARSTRLGRHRKYAMAVGLITLGVALLTLTRGAVVAACVGAMFFLWSKSSTRPQGRKRPAARAAQRASSGALVRTLSRTMAILVPIAGFIVIQRATALRAELNGQVYTNIDTRFEMYRLAWEEFLEHPLTGTGWASFREVSLDATGQSQTFAHNLVVSMLQIGGLLALPYLAALSFLAYRALRRGGPYTAAIVAALAVSMTQPFFESTVCNLIVLPVAFLAGLPAMTPIENRVGGMVAPHTGSPRTGPRSRPRSSRLHRVRQERQPLDQCQ